MNPFYLLEKFFIIYMFMFSLTILLRNLLEPSLDAPPLGRYLEFYPDSPKSQKVPVDNDYFHITTHKLKKLSGTPTIPRTSVEIEINPYSFHLTLKITNGIVTVNDTAYSQREACILPPAMTFEISGIPVRYIANET